MRWAFSLPLFPQSPDKQNGAVTERHEPVKLAVICGHDRAGKPPPEGQAERIRQGECVTALESRRVLPKSGVGILTRDDADIQERLNTCFGASCSPRRKKR